MLAGTAHLAGTMYAELVDCVGWGVRLRNHPGFQLAKTFWSST